MSVVTETIEGELFAEERRIQIACTCVGRCSVLFIAEWDGDQSSERQTSFDFYTAGREDTWRQRIRSAWATLRGKGGYYHGIVASPEQAEELGAWLLNRIEDRPPPSPGERSVVVEGLLREAHERAEELARLAGEGT